MKQSYERAAEIVKVLRIMSMHADGVIDDRAVHTDMLAGSPVAIQLHFNGQLLIDISEVADAFRSGGDARVAAQTHSGSSTNITAVAAVATYLQVEVAPANRCRPRMAKIMNSRPTKMRTLMMA